MPNIYLFIILIWFGSSCGKPDKEISNPKPLCNQFVSKFKYYHECIVLNVSIEDTIKARFLFDTGASLVYLDSIFNLLSITRNDGLNIPFAAKKKTSRSEINNSIKIDSIPFYLQSPQEVISIGAYFENKIDGIIGLHPFLNKVVAINYDDSSFSILNCIDNTGKLKEYNLNNIEIENLQMFVKMDLVLNGITISGKFLIDSGSQMDLILTSETVRRYKLDTIEKKVNYNSVNMHLYGNSKGFFVKSKYVNVFKNDIINQIVYCSKDTLGPFSSANYIGIMGNAILKKFNFILNIEKRALYTSRNNNRIKNDKLIGVGFVYRDLRDFDGTLNICGLYLNSDADIKDLRIGDRITHINDMNVNKLSRKEIDSLLSNSKAYVSITILRDKKKDKKKIFIEELLK